MEETEKNNLVGKWHIYEMEMWDEDYFNMEVQAYIEIEANDTGSFQFGTVTGYMDCEEVGSNGLEFTWGGSAENDEAFGSGWLELMDENTLEGKIKFHMGDSSDLMAKRVIE